MDTFEYIPAWEKPNPSVQAGISTRHGGISTDPYYSLNCGLHVADSAESVVENRRRVAAAVGHPLESWTFGEQVHGCRVKSVAYEDQGKGTVSFDTSLQGVDGLTTDQPGICLGAFFADCVPLYFYDPAHHAAGLAHAGWKGTVGRIAEAMVHAMRQTYGSKPEQILAAIGPSIGICCYEVDEILIEKVKAAGGEQKDGSGYGADQALYYPGKNGKYHLSLQQLNRLIMLKAGIKANHIELSSLCTGCRTDLFYSHRKEHGVTGRMMAWIVLESSGKR